MSNKKFFIPIAVVLIILLWFFLKNRNSGEKYFSGVIEAKDFEIGFEMPGRIKAIKVEEGQEVKTGQLLCQLDDESLKSKLKQAEARLEMTSAQLDNLISGARPEEIKQAKERLASARAELEMLENGPTVYEVDTARAEMLAAKHSYQMMEEGYRQEDIQSARAKMMSASSNLKTAKREFERFRNLYKEGAVSAQQYEYKKNAYENARANYKAAKENYLKLKSGFRPEEKEISKNKYVASRKRYENLATGTRSELIRKAKSNVKYWENQVKILEKGPRKDEVRAAQKRVKEARAAVESAKIELKKSRLYAPIDGIVVTRNFEEGEVVAAGASVITLSNLEQPWVYIFMPEPDVGKLKIGQKAHVMVDSFQGEKFEGKVVRIYEKAEFTPREIQTRKERVNLVFRVKVAVENPGLKLKPGMPADVELVEDE